MKNNNNQALEISKKEPRKILNEIENIDKSLLTLAILQFLLAVSLVTITVLFIVLSGYVLLW